jgi:hypothetical protein
MSSKAQQPGSIKLLSVGNLFWALSLVKKSVCYSRGGNEGMPDDVTAISVAEGVAAIRY